MRDYNFFEIYQKKRGISISPSSPYFIGAIIVFLCVLLSVGAIVRNITLTKDIESTTYELDTIKASEDYILSNQIQSSLEAMKEYKKYADKALNNFNSNNILNTDFIAATFKGVPTNVTLTSFYIDTAKVSMAYSVPDRKSAASLLLGLKETNLYQSLNLTSVTANDGGPGYTAKISGILKAGETE